MRIDPPLTPPDEAPPPGFFAAPARFVDAANEFRLTPELRGRARIQDPPVVLAHAATEFFRAMRAGSPREQQSLSELATAIADLAVTGRKTYERFRLGIDMLALEGATRQRIDAQIAPLVPATDAEIEAAMDRALDRAAAVAAHHPTPSRAACPPSFRHYSATFLLTHWLKTFKPSSSRSFAFVSSAAPGVVPALATPGNVKLLLPPRQSRGNSLGV